MLKKCKNRKTEINSKMEKSNAKIVKTINSYHKLYDECKEQKPDIKDKIEYELFILGSQIKNKDILKIFKLYYEKNLDINGLIEEISIIISSLDKEVEDLYLSKYADIYIKYFDTVENEIKYIQMNEEHKRLINYLNKEIFIFKAQNISLSLNSQKHIQRLEDEIKEHKEDNEFFQNRLSQIIKENSNDFLNNRMNKLYIIGLIVIVFILCFNLIFKFNNLENNKYCILN